MRFAGPGVSGRRSIAGAAAFRHLRRQFEAKWLAGASDEPVLSSSGWLAVLHVRLSEHEALRDALGTDDFGTGQSSLQYLQRLHPDVIEIDRAFIDRVDISHTNATLVSAMTVMAHHLGLRVVAEWIGTGEQMKFLRETGCDEGQGYHFARPMPADETAAWLSAFRHAAGETGQAAAHLERAPAA